MCGICGICMSDSNAAAPRALLERMNGAIAHRGPDGDGFLIDGPVGFGHRRLSIIDLAEGNQPIYNEDGRIGIVFNGEIYNYLELRKDLVARGHAFKTHSDTEVILHLYEELGEACVDQLRGMFVFAIWDATRREVFIARDRLGIKPLFYYAGTDRFLFASELKSIIQDDAVPRRINIETLEEYLTYGYVPGDRCILGGIEKLQPGCTLTWQRGKLRTRKYWDVTYDVGSGMPPEEYEAGLDDVLHEAVQIHMRADVPVGVLLSGGVDSSSMVALAAIDTNIPIKTFSIGFEESDYNELAFARLTAEKFKTDHHEMIVRDRDIEILPKLAWHLDEPFADPSAIPTYYVCREAARHVKVCLSGDGADELFAGYHHYFSGMRMRSVDWIPAAARRAVFGTVAAMMPASMWGKGFVGRVASSGAKRFLDTVGVFTTSDASAILADGVPHGNGRVTRLLEPYFAGANGDILTRMQHADQKTFLPDDILVKVDRTSMQNSLEVRPPYLDHKVVEFANRCPASLKADAGGGKAILKRVLAKRIPPEIITRRKQGFTLPTRNWFRGGLDGLARDMLLSPQARAAAFFKRSRVEQLLRAHQRGMRDLSRQIWSLLILEQWCRSYAV